MSYIIGRVYWYKSYTKAQDVSTDINGTTLSPSNGIKLVSTSLVKHTQKDLVVPGSSVKNLIASPQRNKPTQVASTLSTMASAKPSSTIPVNHICNHPVYLDKSFLKKLEEEILWRRNKEMDNSDFLRSIEQLKKEKSLLKYCSYLPI